MSDFSDALKKLEYPSQTGQNTQQDQPDIVTSPAQETSHFAVDSNTTIGENQGSSMQNFIKKHLKTYALLGFVALLAGVGTGFGGYQLQAQNSTSSRSEGSGEIQQVAGSVISVGDVFGIDDIETFSDSAQGYLEAGGYKGEGSHQLLRPGGETQTVYLTSSITDLDPLVGMEVKVYGETFKGQNVGWLMDVGRVEVIKTKGDRPITD